MTLSWVINTLGVLGSAVTLFTLAVYALNRALYTPRFQITAELKYDKCYHGIEGIANGLFIDITNNLLVTVRVGEIVLLYNDMECTLAFNSDVKHRQRAVDLGIDFNKTKSPRYAYVHATEWMLAAGRRQGLVVPFRWIGDTQLSIVHVRIRSEIDESQVSAILGMFGIPTRVREAKITLLRSEGAAAAS